MTLVNDLLQALLIPLVTWDLHVLGGEVAMPVSPLAIIVAGGALVRGVRLGWRRLEGHVAAAREEAPAPAPVLPT